MNYTFRQLEVYKAVAENKSFTKASEILHLTQPAVSIQFKSFAEQFDFPLIEYQGRKLIITEFGQRVLFQVNEIWDRLALLNHNLNEPSQITGTLRITTVSTGKYIMPYFLTDFLAQHPGIQLHMDVSNKNSVATSLLENTIDFALVSVLPENIDLESETLMKNDLIMVANKNLHHTITKENLKDQNFVIREEGSATRNAMEDFLKRIKLTPQKKLYLTSNEAVKQSVMAGLGISLMPLIGMRTELDLQKLIQIDHPHLPLTSTWRLVWRSNKVLSPAALAFREHLRLNKQKVIEEHFLV